MPRYRPKSQAISPWDWQAERASGRWPRMDRFVVGVDPGSNGGWAVLARGLGADGSRESMLLATARMVWAGVDRGVRVPMLGRPSLDWRHHVRALQELMDRWGGHWDPVVEIPQILPRDGRKGIASSWRAFGRLECVWDALGWEPIYVQPKAWQVVIHGEPTGDKARTKAWARRRWRSEVYVPPRCQTPHEGICDALAIGVAGCMALNALDVEDLDELDWARA